MVIDSTKKSKKQKSKLKLLLKKILKTKIGIWFLSHFLRTSTVLISLFFSFDILLKIIGCFNKIMPPGKRLIYSCFLLYGASEKYRDRFAYGWFAKWAMKKEWKVMPCNLFFQNKKIILVFGITVLEKEFKDGSKWFLDGTAQAKFSQMEKRLETIRKTLGAEQITRAGIIPSVISKLDILKTNVEQKTTVFAVEKALKEVEEYENLVNDYDLVILGGKGHIGKVIPYIMRKKGFKGVIHRIDFDNKDKFVCETSEIISDRPAIILNVTKKGALKGYLPYIGKESVVVNEVYPEPSWEEVVMAIYKGQAIYHIVGAKGKVLIPLGGGYKKYIPCCASIIPANEDEYEIVVWKMYPPEWWIKENLSKIQEI